MKNVKSKVVSERETTGSSIELMRKRDSFNSNSNANDIISNKTPSSYVDTDIINAGHAGHGYTSNKTTFWLTDGMCSVISAYSKSLLATLFEIIRTPIRIRDECIYFWKNPRVLMTEILCGLTMAIIVIPESISFAYMTGVDPIRGLYSTFFLGFIVSALGGRPATISGCSGAMCVILKVVTSDTGPLKDYSMLVRTDVLLITVIFSGLFQILFGMLKLGQLIRLIPQSAMIGFVNGLAIIIFISQLPSFQICDVPSTIPKPEMFRDCPEIYIRYIHLTDLDSWLLLFSVFLCTFCIFFFPRIPYIGKYIPASLVAIILGSAFEHGIVRAAFGVETRILENTAPIKGRWPSWYLPSIPNTTDIWSVILIYGLYSALVALVENIMTVSTICEILDTRVENEDLNQECIGQGLANITAGLFGAIAGNAMIGESNLNVISGARHRLSGMVMAWVLLFIIIWLSPIVNLIPLASFTSVILSITFHTFYWPCLWTMHRMRKTDTLIIILTTVLAVVTNLVIAVGVGFVLASIALTWDSYNMLQITTEDKETIVCSCLMRTLDDDEHSSQHEDGREDRREDRREDEYKDECKDSTKNRVDEIESYDDIHTFDQGRQQSELGAKLELTQEVELRLDLEQEITNKSVPCENDIQNTNFENYTSVLSSNDKLILNQIPKTNIINHHNTHNSKDINEDNTNYNNNSNYTNTRCGKMELKTRTYRIEGPIFFGSSNSLLSYFTPSLDPSLILIDLQDSLINDYSASSALCKIATRYQSLGKIIILDNLTPKSVRQCHRSKDFMKLMKQTSPTSFRLLSLQEIKKEKHRVGVIRAYFCGFEDTTETQEQGNEEFGVSERSHDWQLKTSKDSDTFHENTQSKSIDNVNTDDANVNADDANSNSINSKNSIPILQCSNDKNDNKFERIDILDFNLNDGLRNRTLNTNNRNKRIHHLQMFQPEMTDNDEPTPNSYSH